LAQQFSLLDRDRLLLDALREECIARRLSLTWTAAGECLLDAYKRAITEFASSSASRVPDLTTARA
jgi:hypothetical protein